MILSDIHANLSALREVLDDAKKIKPIGVILIGDLINYGMRPNEVIAEIQQLPYPIVANLYGNHEKAIVDGDTSHFSTERGKLMLEYSKKQLNENSWRFIKEQMNPNATQVIEIANKKVLLIHGSQDDPYWGKFDFSRISDECFKNYDYVITGHSHQPHVIPYYFVIDNSELRNKKKVVFLNPGSVGQPRNQNPCAQYAMLYPTTGEIHLRAVPYDFKAEQALYPDFVDQFYKQRLSLGI